MKLARLLDKMAAVARRDLLTTLRYRNGFVFTAVSAIAELSAFYFLSRTIGPGFRPEGVDYFLFVLVGTGFFTFLLTGVHAFLRIVQEAQQTGTLEVLMTTSTPAPMLVFLSAMSAFAGQAIYLLLYIGGGLLLARAPLPRPNLAGCAVIFVLSLGITIALGVLAAALQLAIQRGSAVVWLFGSAAWLLTGTLFPTAGLPLPLRVLAGLVPLTYSLSGMRLALLQGADLPALLPAASALTGFCLLLLPSSLLIFSWTLRRARLQGTLSFY